MCCFVIKFLWYLDNFQVETHLYIKYSKFNSQLSYCLNIFRDPDQNSVVKGYCVLGKFYPCKRLNSQNIVDCQKKDQAVGMQSVYFRWVVYKNEWMTQITFIIFCKITIMVTLICRLYLLMTCKVQKRYLSTSQYSVSTIQLKTWSFSAWPVRYIIIYTVYNVHFL